MRVHINHLTRIISHKYLQWYRQHHRPSQEDHNSYRTGTCAHHYTPSLHLSRNQDHHPYEDSRPTYRQNHLNRNDNFDDHHHHGAAKCLDGNEGLYYDSYGGGRTDLPCCRP